MEVSQVCNLLPPWGNSRRFSRDGFLSHCDKDIDEGVLCNKHLSGAFKFTPTKCNECCSSSEKLFLISLSVLNSNS